MIDISRVLALVAQEMKVGFTLQSKALTLEEVFAETGLLPCIVRRADQLANFCFGYGLGVTFKPADMSRLGITVIFNSDIPYGLRLMCITEILYELAEAATDRTKIALDDLTYD